jgi:hypothetical protein
LEFEVNWLFEALFGYGLFVNSDENKMVKGNVAKYHQLRFEISSAPQLARNQAIRLIITASITKSTLSTVTRKSITLGK